MNEPTNRTLLVAGLSANVLFLALALIDYAGGSHYMWPIFVGWAFLILLLVILAFVATGIRVHVVQHVAAPAPPHATAAASAPTPVPAQPARPVPVAAPQPAGPFVYNGYTLHSRAVALKNGGTRTIYFFAKGKPNSGVPSAKPDHFHVGVNERTGLPFLKKGSGADGEDLTPEHEAAYRPQCAALTEAGAQCRNSARAASKYCASHFGYQPPVLAKAAAAREDTAPRVAAAPDTLPSVRRRSSA